MIHWGEVTAGERPEEVGVPEYKACSFCRERSGETVPSVERGNTKSKPIYICPTCAELVNRGRAGNVILIFRCVAHTLLAELAKISDEIRPLKPRMQFRIRNYQVAVAVLAGLLRVPLRDIPVMLLFATPAIAALGERWLMSRGSRQLASHLLGVYVLASCLVSYYVIGLILFDSASHALDLLADMSPYTLTFLGCLWACVFGAAAATGKTHGSAAGHVLP